MNAEAENAYLTAMDAANLDQKLDRTIAMLNMETDLEIFTREQRERKRTMGFKLETLREIWDDNLGERVEVGPDREGLDLVELRLRDDESIRARMAFPVGMARLVAAAMIACADELEGRAVVGEEKSDE